MPHCAEHDWVARLRAAGYHVTAATRDGLPPPEHTLPPRQAATLRGIRRTLGRLLLARRSGRVRHAPVP